MRTLLLTTAAMCLAAAGCTAAAPAPSDPSSMSSSPVEASCAHPVPLSGTLDAHAPGYIVVFRAGVKTSTEAARIASVYGIASMDVLTLIPAFSAELDDDVRDRLRCEPSVSYVEYNSVAGPTTEPHPAPSGW
jgi:hypothetical protein